MFPRAWKLFFGLQYLKPLIRIRDPGRKILIRDPGCEKFGSGIRDNHPGSATCYFCLMMEGFRSGSVQIMIDPDLGGPKTYGSGSTTLLLVLCYNYGYNSILVYYSTTYASALLIQFGLGRRNSSFSLKVLRF
jgi:hypothetical protein